MSRATLLALLAFLLAELLLSWALWGMFRLESRQLLAMHQHELEHSYADTIDGFDRLVDVVHDQSIDTPRVRGLLAALAEAENLPPQQAASERRRVRGTLYRELYDSYAVLRRNDVRTLLVVTPDGRAFLRFHRPDLYGDPIAADRPLIGAAIATQNARRGFENGRVVPGYRFVLPLLADGRLLAVVDYGLSYDALRRVLRRADGGDDHASRFLLRRAPLRRVAHPTALELFEPAALGPDLLVERARSPLRTTPAASPRLPVDAIDRRLAAVPAVQRAMAEGRSAARHLCLGFADCTAVALLPIPDSAGLTAGYFVTYHQEPEFAALRVQFLGLLGVGSLLLLGAGFTLRRWLASRQRLRTITEHMAEGLYVMDLRGRIIHVNDAACTLLGFERRALLGRDAHVLLHAHSDGESLPAHLCPVRHEPRLGRIYRNDDEIFRRSDGTLVPVSVLASPLREERQVVGSIVLFRDLTEERAARERLRRADIAFRNLAEAVVVTDADANIQAVNRAFTAITGYAEAEVLGRNPRMLQSGRHDGRFYKRLWHQLVRTGRWEGEIWNRRKSGEVYPEWLKINAVVGRGGTILGYVSVFSDITELRANQERLRRLAYEDQLTGLYNRSAFMEALQQALQHARGVGTRLALLYLDLDRFKRINDSLGHVTGDALLEEVAGRIRAVLRPQDEVARLGGDEYVLLLDDVSERTSPARVAHALLAAVRRPMVLDGRRLHITASVGIALFPDDGGDAGTLLKHADAAMYLAKQQGRDGYRYFTGAMAVEARRRFELEAALREALRRDRLRLVYQPKVSLADGAVIGLEALLRWEHPRDGLLAPGQFLDVARDAGLMQPITEWLLHEAARQCRTWRDAGLRCGRISVNLDTGFFQPLPLEGLLLQIVAEAGISPDDLELEILETAMRADAETAALWQRLVGAGFELSIDDFGTGESSLARIKQLPVRTLKIDRSFVADIEHDDSDRAVIRTIIAMAKTLGKRALAEGVETEAQLRFLLRGGCDAVQGFYFSRPLVPEAVPELLRAPTFAARLRRVRDPGVEARAVVRRLPVG